MLYNWIPDPVGQDLMLAVPAIGVIALWFSSRSSIRRVGRGVDSSREQVEVTLQGLSNEVAAVRTVLEREQPAPPRPAALQAVNLTTRAQILRMHRRGDSPAMISGVVGMPQNEVVLLLKLQQLARSQNSVNQSARNEMPGAAHSVPDLSAILGVPELSSYRS